VPKVDDYLSKRVEQDPNLTEGLRVCATRIKDCDEAEQIEARVLDQKDMLNRVLLCLRILHRDFSWTMGLTSGYIEKVTDQLGVKVGISNTSTILSGHAKAFVSGDAVRKQGGAVHYKLNRRGLQWFESALAD
jgi:hypothetical protein